jgi:hypothetical protein
VRVVSLISVLLLSGRLAVGGSCGGGHAALPKLDGLVIRDM